MVGTHIDVTEQHLAREALQKAFDEIKQSEDRLRLVIDTIPTLVWRAGPDGVPDFLNQTALDYTGLSLDQAETGWPRAFHPDDKKGMLVKWAAIWESGMPGGLEARLRRFDGEYRWFLFQAVPLRDESGNIVKWYGSSTDIEDRRRAEEALGEQRLRDYAETASDWYWETGPDQRVTRISEHVKKTGRPVQFEITEQSRNSVEAWLPLLRVTGSRYLFPSRLHASPHISTCQYARLVHRWVESIGLESAFYGTHSMRRTKAAQIYRKTGNLRAVQLLLGGT